MPSLTLRTQHAQEIAHRIMEIQEVNPNLSLEDIGKLVERTKGRVSQVLSAYGIDVNRQKDYGDNIGDILEGKLERVTELWLNEEELKKIPQSLRAMWFNSLYNNSRTSKGLSNSNVSVGFSFDRSNIQPPDQAIEPLQDNSEK
jgi:hypothetical protein